MNKREECYKRIESLPQAKDFMRVLKKWDVLARRFEACEQMPMVLPDLLWLSQPGAGKTLLLRCLSDYLSVCGSLIDFQGDVKFIEFMLDYYPPEKNFIEVQRLINETNIAAGFRSAYSGIVSVDIDEWLGHCEEKHFITFLEFLASNSDKWIVVFNVLNDRTEDIEKLESILSMYFRIERSVLTLPETEDLMQFVSRRLAEYGMRLNEEAERLVYRVIEKMRQNKYFDGYKTLKILCQDIIYEVYSDPDNTDDIITIEELRRFDLDGSYIKRATWKSERKIGFSSRRGDE